MLQKRLQRVQFAAASFVTGHYVKSIKDFLKLGWLPIEERRDFNLLKQVFKALNSYIHTYIHTFAICLSRLPKNAAIKLMWTCCLLK